MLRTRRAVLAGLACLATTGCLTSSTLVKVQADGSGTIEQTISMKAEAAEQLKTMMKGAGDEPANDAHAAAPAELFSEKDMRDAAPRLGQGVAFVSSTPITGNGRVGRAAVYKFADIRQLRVDQKPAAPGSSQAMGQTGPPENIKFGFTTLPNGHARLSILFPQPKVNPKAATDAAPASTPARKPLDPAQLEMVKKMFDGLKIGVDVEVARPIVKTNSPFVQGNRVTLIEMDFSQLLTNQDALAHLSEPKSIEDAKQMLKNVKGFKVNLDNEISIEF